MPPALPPGEPTRRSAAVAAVVKSYHSEAHFLALFGPDKQVPYTQDLARAFCGRAPSLSLLAEAFGDDARDSWLDIQLTELAAFAGCRDKLSDHQIRSLIDVMAHEWGYLKVTELMYFFRQFKAGAYGKFYGAVDPMAITCALKDFGQERRDILQRLEHQSRYSRMLADPERRRFMRAYAERERLCRFYYINSRMGKLGDMTLEEFKEIWWLMNLTPEKPDNHYFDGYMASLCGYKSPAFR